MSRRLVAALVVALCCLLLLVACAASNESKLSAQPWVATDILTPQGATPVLEGTSPVVYFSTDGSVRGNATVNSFRGTYSAGRSDLTLESLVTTEWDGPEMEQAQEKAMIDALEATVRYDVDDQTLALYDESDDVVMRLETAAEPKLVGPLWRCTELAGEDGQLVPTVGTEPVGAEFAPNGELGGSGGVNTYTTTYEISGDEMTVGPDIAVGEEFGSEEMEEQESRYLQALGETRSYRIAEYQLTLMDESGEPLSVHIPWAPKQ